MGFEPTVTTSATPVFETGPFSRSGTSPKVIHIVAIVVGRTAKNDIAEDTVLEWKLI